MAGEGKLCYKPNDGRLSFKRGGDGRLIFKASVPGETVIDVELNPVNWHCREYGQDHTAQVTCSGSFSSGSGSATTQKTGETIWTFTISKTTRGSVAGFRIVFQVTSTGCISSEDPGVMASIVATQIKNNKVYTKEASVPVQSNGSVTVNFDLNGILISVN